MFALKRIVPKTLVKFQLYSDKKSFKTFTYNRLSDQLKSDRPEHIERLTSRSLIRCAGQDVEQFLQALITNDMYHLTDRKTDVQSMYTMFLNKAGRVLYDSIVYKTIADHEYFIECDKQIDNDLKKHLQIYRVRKKIAIDIINDEFSLWTYFDGDVNREPNHIKSQDNLLIYSDPRLKSLGFRIVASSNLTKLNCLDHIPNYSGSADETHEYKRNRYRLGIGEGVEELPIGKCFPLESNCDFLHGVSFHKGCYLGQEFTARTHHTGVVRKRLLPLAFQSTDLPDQGDVTVKNSAGDEIGKLRGFHKGYGIGLLKIDPALKNRDGLIVGGVAATTCKPIWWPSEVSKENQSK